LTASGPPVPNWDVRETDDREAPDMSLVEGTESRRRARFLAALALAGGLLASTGVAASAAVDAPAQDGAAVVTRTDDRCDYYKKKAEYHYAEAKKYEDLAEKYREKAKEADRKGDHEKAKEYREKAKEADNKAKDHKKEAKEYEKKYKECKHG
jgi:Skp family chaperone for outer membrane proteins